MSMLRSSASTWRSVTSGPLSATTDLTTSHLLWSAGVSEITVVQSPGEKVQLNLPGPQLTLANTGNKTSQIFSDFM